MFCFFALIIISSVFRLESDNSVEQSVDKGFLPITEARKKANPDNSDADVFCFKISD